MTGSLSPGRACPRTARIAGLLARIRDLKAQRDRAILERNGARSALRQQMKHTDALADALTTERPKRAARRASR